MYQIHTVFEGCPTSMSLDNHLFIRKRRIWLDRPIDADTATAVSQALMYLDAVSNGDITLMINSPGGSVTDGNVIIDMMASFHSAVRTLAIGQASSMAAQILACGTPGKRYATKRSSILIHQPLGGVQGQATDMEIMVREMLRVKQETAQLLADKCHKDVEKVLRDIERDYRMTAQMAKDYGIIDHIGLPKEE